MIVTLTCDHRHIYGADVAEFLKDLAGVSSFLKFRMLRLYFLSFNVDLLENNVQSLTMG